MPRQVCEISKKVQAKLSINEDTAAGFANVSIRREYVEGSNSSPVGYIDLTEVWARERGCREMGSDTEIENTESQNFHRRIGFSGESHIVHFIKKI